MRGVMGRGRCSGGGEEVRGVVGRGRGRRCAKDVMRGVGERCNDEGGG